MGCRPACTAWHAKFRHMQRRACTAGLSLRASRSVFCSLRVICRGLSQGALAVDLDLGSWLHCSKYGLCKPAMSNICDGFRPPDICRLADGSHAPAWILLLNPSTCVDCMEHKCLDSLRSVPIFVHLLSACLKLVGSVPQIRQQSE